ncbi:hypothetical protein EVG20_g6955 [Dentipellis fragilis]|uniref:F-box domain-containing protein n=1 Tax=Dentipellis fragilis TaxID=205917 RepID=A0A4Y9YIS7_9AGAM|nr:hypothetical protein EVG20_g6955 [Dentipellis fragilis]
METSHLLNLPQELLIHIISLSLGVHPSPSHILVLNKYVNGFATDILYNALRFTSVRSLLVFNLHPTRLPRTVTVELAGGEVGRGAFGAMNFIFTRLASLARSPESPGSQTLVHNVDQTCDSDLGSGLDLAVLPLDALRLRMHSTANSAVDDTEIHALRHVNPQRFTWTGPDPAHHFSTAIVPVAFTFLAQHMANWTALQHLHLTNIAFPLPPPPEAGPVPVPLFPALPNLLTVYIGQATMLPLRPLAAASDSSIVTSRVYGGARVRRRDVEQAAIALVQRGVTFAPEDEGLISPDADGSVWLDVAVDRIRSVVRCEALTERIIGGDRVEGSAVLD